MNNNIFIAGLGLIGGSIAKSLRHSSENVVIGFDTSREAVDYAHHHGIIDQIAEDFEKGAQQADFIILAAPITETIQLLRQLNGISFQKKVIVTDVASVKSSILETANSLTNKKITFIGGHPMAGSHKKGIHAAKEHLFENAIYVLTPAVNCKIEDMEALKSLLEPLKSRFIILKPNEHDEMTGVISHFPHLIASSLVHQAKKWENTHTYLPNLAAGGFRDITRIASSNPKMWQDIFHHNRFKMAQLLDEWIAEMASLKRLLENNEKQTMIHYLDEAKKYRDGLGYEKKGAIPSFYDLYVDIRDQPGALASVVQILAENNISIANIQILEIREGITGALRLTVSTKEAQAMSVQLLKDHGYEVMIEQ